MKKDFYWASFLQLGGNMWNEEHNTRGREHRSTPCASDVLKFDRKLWTDYTEELRRVGCNMVVIDVGEAMQYESHPELAVMGSWDHDQMRAEIKRLQDMGFEVVPKVNFSACHDAWLKEYSRMISTSVYYKVCADIIHEIAEVFQPKLIHLGMDEEVPNYQRNQGLCICRQHDLWWHDLYFLVNCVEKEGARAWVWSDYIWNHPEEYVKKMPHSVMQSNWYYGDFSEESLKKEYVTSFALLNQYGYEQIPTGSVWSYENNFPEMVQYCKDCIDPDLYCGAMQTVWELLLDPWMPKHHLASAKIAEAKEVLK